MIFDRGWYKRAGVERVMGFCTDKEYRFFMDEVADFERWIGDAEVLVTANGCADQEIRYGLDSAGIEIQLECE